ncbi:tyrosine-type recombinase/integrase [Agriterribacter sp.]|uniref:tyrosine-type recombinase/integrase n=1 Tax=Agriterribacter sp. TaxID=2821509 RepID=UPI002BB77093|nr:tyrosine-type recombinase/integrase [Agriterribacter sp.]HTN06661.1 tyrosine-type recombinase/integrase [Agriterribacter sp.]
MKKKPSALQSAEYILLLQSFTEWLQLLNYSPLSIPVLTRSVYEFLQYLQAIGKENLSQLMPADASSFIALLQSKEKYSSGHINKQIQALKLFSRYIRETGRSPVAFNLQRLEDARGKPTWLTKAEIQKLYDVTAQTILGIRDKAMLAVYYGCGLRLNEGACLDVSDINQTTRVLHVRKGKGYKERFVPIAEKNFEAIKLYLDHARPQLLQQVRTTALFIDANKGKPMQKQSLYVRVKQLAKKARLKKNIGTHTLRHSIATHLLQSGMKLEMIQQFLGHGDLDSTQIYTHLVNGE